MEGSSEDPYDIENLFTPLLISMGQTQENDLPPSPDPCCIYRVPEPLRCVNEKAYTPQLVSIGPLHHGKEGLEEMEGHKRRYLQYFLERTGVSEKDYVTKIKGKEEELRSCYAHTIEFSSEKFVEIILVDAAFIIELLLRGDGEHIKPDSYDRIFYKPGFINFMVPDMLLLENQLPFFILEDLFSWTQKSEEDLLPIEDQVPATKLSVLGLSYEFCKKSTGFYMEKDNWECPSSKVHHFVDLVRTLHLPTAKGNSKNGEQLELLGIPTLTKLHRAGVKFRPVRPSENLFDIHFTDQDGILKIPHLIIDDDTELVLRNLIAFEQCHCTPNSYFFSDYIILIDHLVNTRNDVELLVKEEIVENLLGDNKELSTLINRLCKGVAFDRDEFSYAKLTKDLDNYCKNPWNKWMADLKQTYFDTPWKIISFIVATCVIVLTITQMAWTFTH
ncbi:UPF0481 protein At3g47200-like [Pyrus communis]|uniref:UPF0481 protein At3g47200-like n=1 Tax=Pyrus communis TaxID=23211 RepID=UPI0035BF32D4